MMILVICSPLSEKPLLYFECVPSRAFIHFFLYLGLVHTWLGACKKQLKYDKLRQNAFPVVFSAAVIIAAISETALFGFGILPAFSLWNLFFDIAGAGLGLLTFRLLYGTCY
ncbi:MAG: hypothetical protein ACI865_002689 [Flavobacteriaceae bacterium]|jgi:hypothetical protein